MDVNMRELVQTLKKYEDVEKFGWGTEAQLLSEAQRTYDTGVRQICRETVKGTLPTAEATQNLTWIKKPRGYYRDESIITTNQMLS